VTGLLGLMLLVHARRAARTGPNGDLVLLEHQDRSRWDRAMIEEGLALVPVALTGGLPGPYGVQAAIAALHDEAADVATTDWPQVVALYDVLLALVPSPIIALNRAAAVGNARRPQGGLALLTDLAEEPALRRHLPYFVARADLLHRLGRYAEAATTYRTALDLDSTEPERAQLQRKLAEAESAAQQEQPLR
jgi:RNA polymerase sigma-70 factor (ECF subfamily)